MSRVLLSLALITTVCAFPVSSAESVLSHYRGVTLGDSVEAVVARLHASPSDVKLVHARPTLVQQLSWRPQRFVSGSRPEPDSVSEMLLTFHLGRLARIGVVYDRERIEGLTDDDLSDAFTVMYGTSLLWSRPIGPSVAAPADSQTVGQWRDDETLVLLWREKYPERLRLTITAIDADQALQQAIVESMRLNMSEAPAQDLARRTAEAAAKRARVETIRRDNKAAFKP